MLLGCRVDHVWTDDDGLALVSLGGSQITWQDDFLKDSPENLMLAVEVADAVAWDEQVVADGNDGDARVAEPQRQDWERSSPTFGIRPACP